MKGEQWKKGKSGNPRGRPRKMQSLTSLFKQELEKPCPADSQGRTWKELVALAIVQHAMKGNAQLLREFWDRLAGRANHPAITDQERAERRRRMFDPDPKVELSFETSNDIRDIYGLEPLTYEEWLKS